MRPSGILWLAMGIACSVILYVGYRIYNNAIRVVEVADYNHQTLTLAATMPDCGCLSFARRDATTSWRERLTLALRGHIRPLWSDPWAPTKVEGQPEQYMAVKLEARVNGGSTVIGTFDLKNTDKGPWLFAFDWAGSRVGDHYEVQGTTAGKPIDLDVYFRIVVEDVQQPCDDLSCRFGSLNLNKGQPVVAGNAAEAPVTGARFARNNTVIEAAASPDPGCGCMILQSLAPVELSAKLGVEDKGVLKMQTGALVKIPFDSASNTGRSSYVITARGLDQQLADLPGLTSEQSRAYAIESTKATAPSEDISKYVRILGQLDWMHCGASGAAFTQPSAEGGRASSGTTGTSTSGQPSASSSTQPKEESHENPLSCSYKIEGEKISGTMDLRSVALNRSIAPQPPATTPTEPPSPDTPGGRGRGSR
jgi:hypothetical protein